MAEYASDKSYQWVKVFEGATATGVAVDSQGDVVAGALDGTLSQVARSLVSAGGEDVFVAKLSSTGGFLVAEAVWRQCGSDGQLRGADNRRGAHRRRLHKRHPPKFGPGALTLTPALTSSGGDDVFVAKLSPYGHNAHVIVSAQVVGATRGGDRPGLSDPPGKTAKVLPSSWHEAFGTTWDQCSVLATGVRRRAGHGERHLRHRADSDQRQRQRREGSPD